MYGTSQEPPGTELGSKESPERATSQHPGSLLDARQELGTLILKDGCVGGHGKFLRIGFRV